MLSLTWGGQLTLYSGHAGYDPTQHTLRQSAVLLCDTPAWCKWRRDALCYWRVTLSKIKLNIV